MTALLVALAAVMTLVAAVVSGFETGIYRLSHIRLRYRLSVGDRRAELLDRMLADAQRLLSGVLLAQNLSVYAATAIVTSLFELWRFRWAEAWSTLILSVVFYVFVETTPKNVFRRAADVLVYPLAKPFWHFLAAVRPVTFVLAAIARLVTELRPGADGVRDLLFTRERLAFYISEGASEGILSAYQVELAQKILRSQKVTVARAMVPSGKVASVPADVTFEELGDVSRKKGFSRYPVYKGEKDNVIGILNVYDCHLVPAGQFDAERLMRPALVFSPDIQVTDAIMRLREARQPMGVVAEKGRMVGIATLKDCIEGIVGELYAW